MNPIITVTPAIMDGTTVRWHRDLDDAKNHSPVLSASRSGVMVHGHTYLNTIPQPWIDAAMDAWRRLAGNRNADMSRLATHRRAGLAGPLEPVREESDRA